MTVEKFDAGDELYFDWLDGNGDGFVLNCHKKPKKNYLVLHRATCKEISKRPDHDGEGYHQYTKNGYIKICSASEEELRNALPEIISTLTPSVEAPDFSNRCSKCGLNEESANRARDKTANDKNNAYRDSSQQQPKLKGSRGTWTVIAENGLEIPVCHNIRVDWSQNIPVYNDEFKTVSRKYQRWLAAFRSGYAVIQKGKVEDGVETRARDSYFGIYRIDQLTERLEPDGKTATVTFRMIERITSPSEVFKNASLRTELPPTSGDLRKALLKIAYAAERTTEQSGKERTTLVKWKEFGFQSPDDMANHLEVLHQQQGGFCALTGVAMTVDAGDWCISPDRINSDGHYTTENIQLVARCVNFMKGNTPNNVFLAQLKVIKGEI